tara:strand:- start:162 stop:659 length:498 start_codon:yes stop_codon:yes gene_type:complete
MDISSKYYSVKDRVKSALASKTKALSKKMEYVDEGFSVVLRSNRKLKEQLDNQVNRVDILVHELSHLKDNFQRLIDENNLRQTNQINEAEIPRSNLHNAHAIINRLKGDINKEFYNYYDSMTTPEERRLYHAMVSDVKSACDNLDTEIGEIESGRQDSIAREEST